MSLIALDMARAIRASDEVINIDLVMNCLGCPAGEVVLAQARRRLSVFVFLNVTFVSHRKLQVRLVIGRS
jgi:metal-sulfur cluster biosynthetic enzyme